MYDCLSVCFCFGFKPLKLPMGTWKRHSCPCGPTIKDRTAGTLLWLRSPYVTCVSLFWRWWWSEWAGQATGSEAWQVAFWPLSSPVSPWFLATTQRVQLSSEMPADHAVSNLGLAGHKMNPVTLWGHINLSSLKCRELGTFWQGLRRCPVDPWKGWMCQASRPTPSSQLLGRKISTCRSAWATHWEPVSKRGKQKRVRMQVIGRSLARYSQCTGFKP